MAPSAKTHRAQGRPAVQQAVPAHEAEHEQQAQAHEAQGHATGWLVTRATAEAGRRRVGDARQIHGGDGGARGRRDGHDQAASRSDTAPPST